MELRARHDHATVDATVAATVALAGCYKLRKKST